MSASQEAMHAAQGDIMGEASAAGVYIGCMYAENLDATLALNVRIFTVSIAECSWTHALSIVSLWSL